LALFGSFYLLALSPEWQERVDGRSGCRGGRFFMPCPVRTETATLTTRSSATAMGLVASGLPAASENHV
jgi:hypothetical protein